MPIAVAVLQEIYDWRGMTSSAGYVRQAPRHFEINPYNFTGRRIYQWLGHYDLLVTNACPQLVSSARGRGTPDKVWLSANLKELQPFELLLVCGSVAASTYSIKDAGNARVIELPHPAARMWDRNLLDRVKEIVQAGNDQPSVNLSIKQGELVIKELKRASHPQEATQTTSQAVRDILFG